MVCVAETDAISSLLAQRNRPSFHLLHYLGHGAKLPDAPSGYLIMEDKTGGARALEPFRLHAVLNPTGTPEFELAVLSACHSESVAEAIISLGVRHIVAIEVDASVYEIAAVQFYKRFYQTLLTGGTVQEAFTAGRNAVLTDDRLSREAALHEARKFKLLPEDQSHDTPLRSIASAGGPGAVRLAALPRLTQPPFHRRPPYFIGRNADMRAVLRLLQQHRAALVRGVSGAGKTELAKATAHWLVARDWAQAEHTVFVALVEARTAADARSAIATALGLTLDQLPDNDEAANAALALRLPPAALAGIG